MAIEYIATNPNITIKELSKLLHVDRKTASAWMNHPKFIDKVYDRFMEIAGKELPLILLALIREAKEGNTRAIELALKHWGKLQDTLTIKVEAPFTQHLKAVNGEVTVEDIIDVSGEATDVDFDVLPERSPESATPMSKTRQDYKDTQAAIKKAKKDASRNKRYALRERAKKVNLAPLPPGRPNKTTRNNWMAKLRRLERAKNVVS